MSRVRGVDGWGRNSLRNVCEIRFSREWIEEIVNFCEIKNINLNYRECYKRRFKSEEVSKREK